MSRVVSVDQELLVTAEGYEQLRCELETLRSDGRRSIGERIREARADGDLNSNPALFDAVDEQRLLERRIAALEAQLGSARIVAPAADGSVGIGSFVRVRDLQDGEVAEYELVGAIESDVGNGRVSVDAPVGRALVNRRAGELAEVETPSGRLRFRILSAGPTPTTRATRAARETATRRLPVAGNSPP